MIRAPGLASAAIMSIALGAFAPWFSLTATLAAQTAAPAAVDTIERILRDQYDALLALDATRYASHLAEDAVWENALGDRYVGRDSIRAFNERVAATMRGARYDSWTVRISFVTDNVAIADVSTTLRGQNIGGRRLVDRPMLNVYVLRRESHRWRIAHTRIRDTWVLRYADEARDVGNAVEARAADSANEASAAARRVSSAPPL